MGEYSIMAESLPLMGGPAGRRTHRMTFNEEEKRCS
jgi:hypothetical protein